MRTLSFLTLCLGTLLFVGCGGPKPNEQTAEKTPKPQHDEEPHQHPSEGPHGGILIELGEEEYHAELVQDEPKKTITVYVLDSKAKNAVPIEAQEITISAKSQSYPLEAQPLEGEAEGKSSRFVSTDKALNEYVGSGHAHARLILKIGDQSYNGAIDIHAE